MISRSSVPCKRAIRSSSGFRVGILPEDNASWVGCQQESCIAEQVEIAAGLAVSLRGGWPIANRPQLTKLPHNSTSSFAIADKMCVAHQGTSVSAGRTQ
jgi:hypothetical protein